MGRGSHNPLYGELKPIQRRPEDADAALQSLWHPMKHIFDRSDGGSFCSRCGAVEEDARYGAIGCEASPLGNEPGYHGFALTPIEQALGIALAEKATALANSWTPTGEFEARLSIWNDEIEARALGRAKRRRPRPKR